MNTLKHIQMQLKYDKIWSNAVIFGYLNVLNLKKKELFIYKKDSQFSVWGSLFITYYLLNLLILFKSLK